MHADKLIVTTSVGRTEDSNPRPFLGFLFDIARDAARGTALSADVFVQALTLAGRSGYTHFLPYLENMIRLPSIERAASRAAYSASDWRRFQETARRHALELVPHFNVIGHTERIVEAYPDLGGRVSTAGYSLDPERPSTREWTLRCLGEFCEISESEYFLIGGDEWQPPRHLLERPGFDVARAWVRQMNLAVEFLVARGRRPIVWHDMLLHYPTALRELSRQAVIAFWFYDEDSDYPALDLFQRHGFTVLMATGLLAHPCRLIRRGVRALRCAAGVAARHRARGLIVTTWENCGWESQRFNIPAAAAVLRGEPPPPIVEALTLAAVRHHLPVEEQLQAELKRPIWRDHEKLRDSIAHEQPRGRQHTQTPSPPAPLATTNRFALTVEGTRLRFHNHGEQFDILPVYGASLQSWIVGNQVIIPAGDLSRALPPGGYRSYAAVGGFRPIWALGAHSNPCILWQYPYEWEILEQTPDRLGVELRRDFPHVAIRLRVRVRRGQPGFEYEARAVNRLEHAWGAFNFNLPLALTPADLPVLKFQWQDETGAWETTLLQESCPAFAIPARGPLTVVAARRTVRVEAAAEQTALYFVDWSPTCVTPDLHGVYRPLAVGEETVTRWRLTAQVTS